MRLTNENPLTMNLAEMKIYIVTEGEYSDYRIKAVFSTRQKAKAYIAASDGKIETYTVDVPLEELFSVCVRMTKEGKVTYSKIWEVWDRQEPFFTAWPNEEPELGVFVLGRDKERAVKVANELRQRVLALNIWGYQEKLRELK